MHGSAQHSDGYKISTFNPAHRGAVVDAYGKFTDENIWQSSPICGRLSGGRSLRQAIQR
jgi:hypothetical protein